MSELLALIRKYNAGQATPEEAALLEGGYAAHQPLHQSELAENELEYELAMIAARLPGRRRLWPRWVAAAAALVLLAFWLAKPAPDVAPGTAVAVLKRGGKPMILSQVQGRFVPGVRKTAAQQLTFDGTGSGYDTIQLPAGARTLELRLADSSRIVLNAATSLRLPQTYNSRQRPEIELIYGEAYFDIRHNPDAPLVIKTAGGRIADIGTRFNVAAYPDEAEVTTLAEGALTVNGQALRPGQQYRNLQVAATDPGLALAWVEGYFRFNGEDIRTIMKELARWYDIEVVYEGAVTTRGFYGRIARDRKLSTVLRMLERTKNIHFKIEGRRVTVSPKK